MDDEVMILITDCENRDKKLNEWERKFLESIKEAYLKYKGLTSLQLDTLNNIWERATSIVECI